MEHLTDMTWAALVADQLRVDEKESIQRHLVECPECWERWLDLQVARRQAEGSDTEDQSDGISIRLYSVPTDTVRYAAATDEPPLPMFATDDNSIAVSFVRESDGQVRAQLVARTNDPSELPLLWLAGWDHPREFDQNGSMTLDPADIPAIRMGRVALRKRTK